MANYIYFHIWDNHFKMWGYESFKNKAKGKVLVIFYWGKIIDSLSKLQQKEKEMDYWDAYDLIKKKIDEKLRKGYVPVRAVDYTKFAFQKISLSQFIKIIEKQK